MRYSRNYSAKYVHWCPLLEAFSQFIDKEGCVANDDNALCRCSASKQIGVADYGSGLDRNRDLFRHSAECGVVGGKEAQRFRDRLLSGRTQPRVVDYWRIDFRFEHWFRARGWSRRRGSNQWSRFSTLRASRLVFAGAGMGVRPVLHAIDGVHHAGIPGAPL